MDDAAWVYHSLVGGRIAKTYSYHNHKPLIYTWTVLFRPILIPSLFIPFHPIPFHSFPFHSTPPPKEFPPRPPRLYLATYYLPPIPPPTFHLPVVIVLVSPHPIPIPHPHDTLPLLTDPSHPRVETHLRG